MLNRFNHMIPKGRGTGKRKFLLKGRCRALCVFLVSNTYVCIYKYYVVCMYHNMWYLTMQRIPETLEKQMQLIQILRSRIDMMELRRTCGFEGKLKV